MIKQLYEYRFDIFFITQLFILFGSLLFNAIFFESIVSPILFLVNILAGILLLHKNRKLLYISFFLLILSLFLYIFNLNSLYEDTQYLMQFCIYFLFYGFVAYQTTIQVWRAKLVNRTVIIGLMSGYVSLGFISYFIFMIIELYYPGSFQGFVMEGKELTQRTDTILYYSYITLLTIGYGDVLPISPIAQKASILSGLMGQFYTVIVTAIVVGKYLVKLDK